MIQAFTHAWFAGIMDDLATKYARERPGSYFCIFKDVITALHDGGIQDDWYIPDPERITVIDHGDYQGTLVFVVASTGYQPSMYWYVKQSYGSCSGCDAFQDIQYRRDYLTGDLDSPPGTEEVTGYLTLALHFIQGLRRMGVES